VLQQSLPEPQTSGLLITIDQPNAQRSNWWEANQFLFHSIPIPDERNPADVTASEQKHIKAPFLPLDSKKNHPSLTNA
jgi:hypothetical protein